VHRPTWPSAKSIQFKTFVHQDFYSTHLRTFVGLSNPHISKTTIFISSQNSHTKQSSYAVVHRQPWPCANPSELKTFVHQEFHGIHWGTFVGLSNPPRISFFHKTPHQAIYLCRGAPPTLAMCTTLRIQNIRAPRFSWYSFGDICRPFQPSHRKNHRFHFFTKLPTKPSTYVVVHHQPWPSAQPSELKTFVHQDFHGIHLGIFFGLSNPLISKTTNFIFSQNSPPRSLAMSWCIHNLGHVQTPPNSKLSCTKNFMVFIWGHLFAFPTITSQKPRISFFHKTPHQAL